MRAYLGFIPFAVVAIPCAVAAVRQTLFYKGCMDGYGYILIAMAAFTVGGVLNLGYLAYAFAGWDSLFSFSKRHRALIAKLGFGLATLLFAVQLVIVAMIAWRNLATN